VKARFVKRSPLHLIAAAFYRIAYKLHHKLFLRPQPPIQTPVIIVGSYLAGGAGKTPFTIWLARHFQEQGKRVAVLCHSAAWDEFIMMQREFGNGKPKPIEVFATKNRYAKAKSIQHKFDIILCDDGFEDSRFTDAKYICLDWQEPPTSWKNLLPKGPFRSLKQDHDESKIIHLSCITDIHFAIKSITNYVPGKQFTATIICGLGSPKRFIEDIRVFGKTADIEIARSITRPDHDRHFSQIVQAELLQGSEVIVTQKDASRLPQALLSNPKFHIAMQEIKISDKAIRLIQHSL
jgi:tetraacyldisaccharide 4'-kinase